MRKIEVVPYENHWTEKFHQEAKRLKEAMPEPVKVHHIGSTSVPGLAAKPIVDMIMEVKQIERIDQWSEYFRELGTHQRGKRYFRSPLFYSWNRRKSIVSFTYL